MFDNLVIKKNARELESNPIEIFNRLTLRGSIENMWAPQAEALKSWYDNRALSDVVIEMNTGGGKTLVGLLIAQSIVNEKREKCLFLCPTTQLVEQAAKRAGECGLNVATYINRNWSCREVFDRCEGPCITTYAAVFNGLSIFNRENVYGYIFDDSHVVEGILRDCFSLKFERGSAVYNELIYLFKDYFESSYQQENLNGALSGSFESLLYVPQFEIRKKIDCYVGILKKYNVETDDKNKYSWNHIKNEIVMCSLLVDGARVEITPPSLPIHRLNAFSVDCKRVYLTATLPIKTDFIRTFGVEQPYIITPQGKSGDAQRLFIFPNGDDEEQIAGIRQLIASRKACIIVTSYKNAEIWSDIGQIFDKSCGEKYLEAFRQSQDFSKLILVARYDGVDLPGDSCKILVISQIPSASHHFDKFLESKLQIHSLRSSKTAIRIIQAIGRIFRSNTDHGIVFVNGVDLERWIFNPQNLAHFPEILQKQLKLSSQLKDNVNDGRVTYESLIESVLSGNKEWDSFYSNNLNQMEQESGKLLSDWIKDVLLIEKKAFMKLWEKDRQSALRLFSSLCERTKNQDQKIHAWYKHWLGFVYEELGNHISAYKEYRAAANFRGVLGVPENIADLKSGEPGEFKSSEQSKSILKLFNSKYPSLLAGLNELRSALIYGDSTNQCEEALKNLGSYLGLASSRPDKEERTGPDVLWVDDESKSLVIIEAKTNKSDTSKYGKDEVSQFYDHIAYTKRLYEKYEKYLIIVGKNLEVSSSSNPPQDLKVVNVEQFQRLVDIVLSVYNDVNSLGSERSDSSVYDWLVFRGVDWPRCVTNMISTLAIDLKQQT